MVACGRSSSGELEESRLSMPVANLSQPVGAGVLQVARLGRHTALGFVCSSVVTLFLPGYGATILDNAPFIAVHSDEQEVET